MTPKIKQRIEQLCRSEIPEGYKKTKAGILPVDWDVHMLGECLSRVGDDGRLSLTNCTLKLVSVLMERGIFYKEPVTGAALGNKSVFGLSRTAL